MLLSQVSLWELRNFAAERREAAKEISAQDQLHLCVHEAEKPLA